MIHLKYFENLLVPDSSQIYTPTEYRAGYPFLFFSFFFFFSLKKFPLLQHIFTDGKDIIAQDFSIWLLQNK